MVMMAINAKIAAIAIIDVKSLRLFSIFPLLRVFASKLRDGLDVGNNFHQIGGVGVQTRREVHRVGSRTIGKGLRRASAIYPELND